jgi:hypothetical protein
MADPQTDVDLSSPCVYLTLPPELSAHMRVAEPSDASAYGARQLLLDACRKKLGHAYLYVVDQVAPSQASSPLLQVAPVQRHVIVHADHVECHQAGAYFSLHEPEWISTREQSSDPFGLLAGVVNAALTGESVEGGGSAPTSLWQRPHLDRAEERTLVVSFLLQARLLEHRPEGEQRAHAASVARALSQTSARCPLRPSRGLLLTAHGDANVTRHWNSTRPPMTTETISIALPVPL